MYKKFNAIRLTALFPGLRGWAGTRKVKPIWILLKQETLSGSGISWAICKSAPCSRQTPTPVPLYSVFTGRMPFLPPNQRWGNAINIHKYDQDISRTTWQAYGMGIQHDTEYLLSRTESVRFYDGNSKTSLKSITSPVIWFNKYEFP